MFYFQKKIIENQKFHFLIKIYKIQNKRWDKKSCSYKQSTIFFPFWDILEEDTFFLII